MTSQAKTLELDVRAMNSEINESMLGSISSYVVDSIIGDSVIWNVCGCKMDDLG